ncbi:ABC transporter ATP-binding protein [Thermodesulfobacteriota bacterium]
MKKLIEAILFFPSVTRGKIGFLLIIILVATLFEGFGVAMLFPVMDFIEKGRDFSSLAESSRVWMHMDKIFDLFFIPKTLIALMVIVFGLLMIRQLFNYLRRVYSAWLSEGIYADIRSAGFKWFVEADFAFYDDHGVGKLINALIVDGMRAGGGIFTFFNLLAAVIIFVLYLIFLILLSPGMTLFAIAIMLCVGLVLKTLISRSAEIGTEVSKYNEKISFSIVERLNGIRLLKLSGTEKKESEFIKGLSEKIRMNTFDIARIRARMEFVVDPMVIFAGLIILYFSVEIFHMTLAKTGIFIFVLLRLMPYTKEVFNSRQALAGFSGSLFRVQELLAKSQSAHIIKGGDIMMGEMRRGIKFKNVSFHYKSDDKFALKDINAFIPAGRMTALVGRSGAGKSTFVELIPRLRVNTRGEITIDEIPIKKFDLGSLRRSIAFVSQEGFLFDDTIENNIRYCRPGAKMGEIERMARMAYADHFIKELPKGYQTVVGERGTKISGGQKQRIILARALLQKASVIILDEPTSALDYESEQFIQKAMQEIRSHGHIAMLIIAHRLSTIRSADQIIVLDKGKVVECGSHGELIHGDAWYADMVKIQATG